MVSYLFIYGRTLLYYKAVWLSSLSTYILPLLIYLFFYRIMFFTDWGTFAKIEKANMDGTSRSVIHFSSLVWPNGIAIDSAEEKLYWTDAYLDKIEYSNLDGSDRRTLIDEHTYLPTTGFSKITNSEVIQHPFALELYGDKVCWTDWTLKSVICANKYSGGETDFVAFGLGKPEGLHVLTRNITDGMNFYSMNHF